MSPCQKANNNCSAFLSHFGFFLAISIEYLTIWWQCVLLLEWDLMYHPAGKWGFYQPLLEAISKPEGVAGAKAWPLGICKKALWPWSPVLVELSKFLTPHLIKSLESLLSLPLLQNQLAKREATNIQIAGEQRLQHCRGTLTLPWC